MSVSSLSQRSSWESLRSVSSAPSVHSEPDPFPPALAGPMVWQGKELDPKDYVIELEPAEVENVRAAVVGFKLLGLPRGSISQDTFHLKPELAYKLSAISDRVHRGSGISVVRGLHTARFNDEEAVIAFVGISSYVCSKRATDAYANQTLSKLNSLVLPNTSCHVRDATHDAVPNWAKDLGLAGSKLTTAMEFHCDRFSGDVLALYVRDDGSAQGGGEQFVASFWRIYNELLATDPDVLETLSAADWPFELKEREAKVPHLEYGPAVFFAQGKPICQIVRAPLLGSSRIPRSDTMPRVTVEQAHSLESVEKLARQFCSKVNRQNGDIQFINNLSIMHARSAYGTRTSERRSTRHLLRMFLRDPTNAWEKPTTFSDRFDDPFVEGREQELPILDLDPWRKISGRESHG
ncbi:hypothetical protein GQ43DRAFT_414294 [Delitschia confertaspora ATCC 74209]|uniref:TauD/TfdA-like domain-containing protein n=1 Tax=Delitschia confertaspora ATCC 74209 TaxID=1513339 RepID=A0A9P4JRV9_9PLEO|nr:hypothetical protein GQ43DRAFT_414294 [Delitschia confertaspora ATCC 74209]